MVYGLEVYAANGTKVIEASSRVTRSFGSGTTSNITHGSYVDISVTGKCFQHQTMRQAVCLVARMTPRDIQAIFGYQTIWV
jgi:hypothetical protein